MGHSFSFCQLMPESPPEPAEPEADFFEPLTFDWDEDTDAAIEAAREFSEQTTAEY